MCKWKSAPQFRLASIREVEQFEWWWCYPTPSEGCKARSNSMTSQQFGQAPSRTTVQRRKKQSQIWRAEALQMRNCRDVGEPVPAVDGRRRYKKNSPPSVLSCLGNMTKKAVSVAAKSGQFTADTRGKGRSCSYVDIGRIWQNRDVRDASSPRGAAIESQLCGKWGQWARHFSIGLLLRICKRVSQFIAH